MEYQETKNKIAHNKKFLNGPAGTKLPDNGAKLRSFIESEEKTLENRRVKTTGGPRAQI